MPILRQQIFEKLESLDGKEFQKLGNDFIRIIRHDIFSPLNEMSGMNLKKFPVIGQPDSYSFYKGGLAHLHISKNPSLSDIKKSIDNVTNDSKLQKLKVTYLCFIFYSIKKGENTYKVKRVGISEHIIDIQEYCEKKLNVSRENIEFIFGDTILSELEQPKYSPLLYDDLNILIEKFPFYSIDKVRLFGVQPSKEDFERNKVFLSKKHMEDAYRRMYVNNAPLGILGMGTCGKTTYALAIGYFYLNDGKEVLYYDFKKRNDPSVAGDILKAISIHHHTDLLLIFDNVHSYDDMYHLYGEITSFQRSLGKDKFRVLYVGNKVWPKEEEKNFFKNFIFKEGNWVINLGAENRKKDADKYDLEGFRNVYLYFISKYENKTNEPSTEKLKHWCHIFGNDLNMFSFALNSFAKNGSLINFDADRKEVEYNLGKTYLSMYKSETKDFTDFIDLCSLSAINVAVPHKFFERENRYEPLFQSAINEGIVLDITSENKRYFVILYPALAKAILAVHFQNKRKELDNLISCIRKTPNRSFITFLNLKRFYNKDIQYIYSNLFGNNEYLISALENDSFPDMFTLKDVNLYINGFENRVYQLITTHSKDYARIISTRGIQYINTTSEYLQKDEKLIDELLKEIYQRHYDKIISHIPNFSVHEITNFLKIIKEHKQDEFLNSILNDLSDLSKETNGVTLCLNEKTDLTYIQSFLKIIKPLRTTLFNQITDVIYGSTYRDTLINQINYMASYNPLSVRSFILFSKDVKSNLDKELLFLLLSEKNINNFSSSFLKSSPNQKNEYIKLMSSEYPDYTKKLISFLNLDNYIHQL